MNCFFKKYTANILARSFELARFLGEFFAFFVLILGGFTMLLALTYLLGSALICDITFKNSSWLSDEQLHTHSFKIFFTSALCLSMLLVDPLSVFIIYFLLIACLQDLLDQEFESELLAIPLLCSLINYIRFDRFDLLELTLILIFLSVLIFLCIQEKFGSGDLAWFLIFYLSFGFSISIKSLLAACLIAIICCYRVHMTKIAFLPFMTCGLIFCIQKWSTNW